jgi:superfamily II DNA or RNA helicase
MDFEKLLADADQAAPIEPRELFASLPNKAEGYGYLRDVQGQVLSAWHEHRGERDLVIKVNTGAGKTIDGLIILQSYLNEGLGPALYVAPNRYLVAQVIEEADASD